VNIYKIRNRVGVKKCGLLDAKKRLPMMGTPQQGWRHCWSSFGQFFPKNNQLKIGQKATADSPAAAQKHALLRQYHQK